MHTTEMRASHDEPSTSTTPRRRHRSAARLAVLATVATIAIGLALLLSACGGSSPTTSEGMPMGPVPAGEAVPGGEAMPMDAMGVEKAPNAATPNMPSSTLAGDQIIRTAYVSLRVADVPGSVQQVVRATASASGFIVDQQVIGQGDSNTATLTAKVPASALDDYLATIQRLGTVDAVTISSQDVTAQAVDLDARIAALQASIRRLTTLMEQATNVTDLVAIEAEQTRRQADLDALVAQRAALGDQVAMSTVTITLSPIVPGTEWAPPGFGPGLLAGWSALTALVGIAVTAAGFLVPFAVILAIVAIPLTWWLVRRHRGRKRSRTLPAPQQGPTVGS